MYNELSRQYFKIVTWLSLAIAVTIHFNMVLSYFLGDEIGRHGHLMEITLLHLGIELSITYIVAFLMFTLNFFIINPVGRHEKLNILKIVLAVFLTFIFVTILNFLLFSLKNSLDPEFRPRMHRGEFDFRNFFVSSLVIGGVFIIRLVFQKQAYIREIESLKREALQSQYDSLKNQLSPHFMFNSLTALQVLIKDAPDKAQEYVNSLSKALRYTLQSNEKQLVPLDEEMRFMDSYFFLIRIRFDTHLILDISIPDTFRAYLIPPLTLQTLVENAIKHNEVSKRNPLTIFIKTTDSPSVVVSNNINKKFTDQPGTGIGLKSLSKQIQLLVGKEVMIKLENNLFEVEVPLIKL